MLRQFRLPVSLSLSRFLSSLWLSFWKFKSGKAVERRQAAAFGAMGVAEHGMIEGSNAATWNYVCSIKSKRKIAAFESDHAGLRLNERFSGKAAPRKGKGAFRDAAEVRPRACYEQLDGYPTIFANGSSSHVHAHARAQARAHTHTRAHTGHLARGLCVRGGHKPPEATDPTLLLALI